MSDFKKQFDDLQEEINNKKLEKAKLEERLKNLNEERTKINEDLKALNVSSDDLDSVIENLESEIKGELEKCQKSLN
jgi:predicted  nucleic acid-binding Zn-ribbon protein